MKQAINTNGKWRRAGITGILYLILCAFFWGFLTVETRSHNRLSHEPITMAQLTIQPDNTISFSLAEETWHWYSPDVPENLFLWLSVLPEISVDTAIEIWHFLWQYDRL